MGRGGYHSSRAEFLSDEAILKYNRNGGCFVTTKKAIAFVIFALASLLAVVLLMYYYGPNRGEQKVIKESNDIEKLINDTLNENVPKEEWRLPNTLYPLRYTLKIHPILDEYSDKNFTFTGRVKILVKCLEETNRIVLNWDDLNITDSDVRVYTIKQVRIDSEAVPEHPGKAKRDLNAVEDDATTTTISTEEVPTTELFEETTTGTEPPDTTTAPVLETTTESSLIKTELIPWLVREITRDEENFKITIHTRKNLKVGENYTVDIKFSGQLLNNLVGLYKSHYVDLTGRTKWLATTHFQPIYARRVFPCFDEPKFKAPFKISIARRTNMTALSNMPLKQTEPMNETSGWVWDHFEETPPMSTYIVAFTVSDFESISSESTTAGPVVKIWAPKDDLSQAHYALDVTHELLPFLEEYFDIKYPLPKLDMLAIPNFGKGAMENWGLMKSSLLFDPNSRSIKTKSFIMARIVHELAHQWFGNLVTMEWWSDLWLNEGFGTFMAEVAITKLRPRWHAYSSVKIRDTYNTLYFDTLKSTRSIQTDIENNAQIEQIFDTIIYQKGSSILKMLNYTLSESIFIRGIQHYLKKYSYQSSTQDDLWALFTKTAQNQSIIPNTVTVKALMNSWSTQPGYPYITAMRNYSGAEVVINQTKMTEDTNITTDALWYVPVTYMTKNNDQVRITWLEDQRRTVLQLNTTANDSWLLLNIDETGFYRVNYDTRNWKLLVQQLRRDPGRIPVANRGQLIDDAFQLANAGIINYTIAFDLVKYLHITEPNYIPWYSALRNMEELRVIISNYEYSGLYDNFLLKLVKPMFHELTTTERQHDTQNEKLLRLHIVTSACKLRYGPCIDWARVQYYEWIRQPDPDERNPISVDYRFIVQCSAIKSGGPIEWDFLWNRTLSPSIAPVDLQTAYLSLGCTYDPWLINRYLEYSLSGNISLEYVPYVWQSINHPVGVRTGFQFLRLNWERIYDTYEDIYLVFSTIFHDFVSQLSTEVDLEDLTTFYKLHQTDLKSVSTILQGTVDRMKIRIKWKTKHLESVVNWLKRNKY
ncbi:hypothetical protein NQ315_012634 [Exocentrus adspersus]|uniref:Aminopeptidase n=1 Tax=Exocentrus adspersus TaxID=1586481 RepID=A0AAV8VSY5_9CUCU|nr:hypothetical protein NQ315_012634 [Exocentrus adspersus]